jgi:hypothetical protein
MKSAGSGDREGQREMKIVRAKAWLSLERSFTAVIPDKTQKTSGIFREQLPAPWLLGTSLEFFPVCAASNSTSSTM